jgi:O-antigen/teichoic acid export membrane protein
LSKLEVGKGAIYLYIDTITGMFFGYIFWLFLSKITAPEIIGTSSAVVSFATILATIVAIGVPNGVQRFLGKSFSEQKIEDTKVAVKASLFLVFIGILVCSTVILIVKDWVYDVFRIDLNLLIITMLFIASSAIGILFRSVIIASLKTKVLIVVSIFSTIAKFVLAIVLLVLNDTGVLGVTISITIFPILTSILLSFNIMAIFKPSRDKPEVSFSHYLKNILVASIVFWIPSLINIMGIQLGTIVVHESQGASQAGLYFIALSIATGISIVVSVLSIIAYPTLSGMQDGRKRFAWRLTKISLIITLPLSSSIIFYSKEVMQLFGRGYIEGSSILEILLLSILPTAVMSGINTLVYSYGNYRQVLIIGLAGSIPRTILYFILVAIYGSIGAAISYTIGAIIGFAVSIPIAKKISMKIFWKDLTYILIIPTGFAVVLRYFGINYMIAIIIVLITSYILFLKLQILNRSDIQDSLGLLPPSISNPIINVLNTLGKKLNRSY